MWIWLFLIREHFIRECWMAVPLRVMTHSNGLLVRQVLPQICHPDIVVREHSGGCGFARGAISRSEIFNLYWGITTTTVKDFSSFISARRPRLDDSQAKLNALSDDTDSCSDLQICWWLYIRNRVLAAFKKGDFQDRRTVQLGPIFSHSEPQGMNYNWGHSPIVQSELGFKTR